MAGHAADALMHAHRRPIVAGSDLPSPSILRCHALGLRLARCVALVAKTLARIGTYLDHPRPIVNLRQSEQCCPKMRLLAAIVKRQRIAHHRPPDRTLRILPCSPWRPRDAPSGTPCMESRARLPAPASHSRQHRAGRSALPGRASRLRSTCHGNGSNRPSTAASCCATRPQISRHKLALARPHASLRTPSDGTAGTCHLRRTSALRSRISSGSAHQMNTNVPQLCANTRLWH